MSVLGLRSELRRMHQPHRLLRLVLRNDSFPQIGFEFLARALALRDLILFFVFAFAVTAPAAHQ